MMLQSVKEPEKMADIDAMFSDLLGEIDHLSQSLISAADTPEEVPVLQSESTFSIGFTDLNESLNELEDHDLDALVADLGSKSTTLEMRPQTLTDNKIATPAMTQRSDSAAASPPPSKTAESSGVLQTGEPKTKAEKIKLALEKLKEANVRKLIVKVLMSDGSFKTLMVDGRQTVRELLDMLFEKTHCDCSIDWSLCETNPELQIERGFEDHECLVEPLSAWTRHSENKICFVLRPQKYVMFTDPQLFYMWKKQRACLSNITEQAKELLLKEHFGGSTLIVPDLEGVLHLKEDGKKVWKPRYFVLRASGIYFVPKGKSKSCSDLACFVHFEKVNIYTTNNYKQRYKAPTNFCFILKHPCIQKESHYIKFLCCDNEHTLLLWVNSIRIAKYGTVLYQSYQTALRRASTLQSVYPAAFKDKNGQVPQISPQPAGPSPPKTTSVEDYPHELPPDFIPPPPPEHAQV
ncbi:amyloid beta A4 precursor protein-binding family B member 1-interacting protein-like isoform X1 [Thunnus albacares]|uniref:amyloid beta A4 precursor protein-binding family B member 1-interacting protein-like isoform X1 n=1 Tax=Thunnus maccoyii TaxID=8240 RepID=UPI001C4A7ED6|nr:amyloid beta A4 precursor protein-binding family B member 1-interacting protein-like isoform X1 [Thunnus maccoyii]XP_042284004.1 amyloid beta A4 precursor protein-binding family B member 1-interacting protein-like isoform X1 [Thunnus maccoyii]XP_044223356.1 amyloid beta A4 precursor protein-binding family B member 1-interacting protein-like isoform X1 [Thunnus albacares]XP_044223357.1 amyloid beta A4 precursor protein-binding family B member 1-interacting protein-like isoform X1 [Thunnus alba